MTARAQFATPLRRQLTMGRRASGDSEALLRVGMDRLSAYDLNSRKLATSIASIVARAEGCEPPIVSAERNPYAGRHDSGLATCLFADGRSRRYFWKFGVSHCLDGLGRLGCVAYEADVCRTLESLRPSPAPAFIGSVQDGETVLVVTEFIPEACRVHRTPEAGAIAAAAAAIGGFQAHAAGRPELYELEPFDVGFYGHFADAAAALHPRSIWLQRIAETYPQLMVSLQESNRSLAHGEFYGRNVLVSARGVHVTDWEWCGVGMGELDLAALIEAWKKTTRAEGICAYAWARGFCPSNPDYLYRLTAAELFFVLRRLAKPPASDGREDLRHARRLAAALGISATPRADQ